MITLADLTRFLAERINAALQLTIASVSSPQAPLQACSRSFAGRVITIDLPQNWAGLRALTRCHFRSGWTNYPQGTLAELSARKPGGPVVLKSLYFEVHRWERYNRDHEFRPLGNDGSIGEYEPPFVRLLLCLPSTSVPVCCLLCCPPLVCLCKQYICLRSIGCRKCWFAC